MENPLNPDPDLDLIASITNASGGTQPDTLLISPKIYNRMFRYLERERGNSHQRRMTRRRNARRIEFRKRLAEEMALAS